MKAIKLLSAALVCLFLAACGKTPVVGNPDEVAQKIENHQELTPDDYTVIIDYVANYSEKAQQYYNVINAEPSDTTATAVKATNDLANLYAESKYLDLFRAVIMSSDESQMGKKNMERAEAFTSLEAFPIPEVSDSTMLNPDVVGDRVDMPADSGSVIANSDGEVVD